MTLAVGLVIFTSLLLGGNSVFAQEPVPSGKPFPKTGLLPKEEIGALRLRKQYPEYDGRGVTVAIFDTGIDPGAAGLQTTPDGKPKIVDIIDATGSGDVLMTEVRKPQGRTLEGLTGRTLKLNPKWKNPKGEYRIGMKSGFTLFPGALVTRRKRERRKAFLKKQRRAETRLRRQISAWDGKHPKPSPKQKRWKAELQARLKQLQAHAEFPDPGPVFDCVVFHDGQHWRAVVDTDEDGDLTEEHAMTNYRVNREFASFGKATSLSFSVNILEHGKRLSIVVASGAHGTHVAGIVAAHYPKQPELDGIAPGAQIVSVKIGDTRLGSMETGAALIRGLRTVIDTKCDLINMSYGEASSVPDRGRIISLCNDIVRTHGVIFVASAGNEGPALSTVGTPGGTTSDVIGVGAYVSPQMMAVEYTLRKTLPGMPYTWTSRGPTFDGDMGVDIFAPGGAIAPVPRWTLQKSMRMNGTSMASPNTCGAAALLLSGLKATKTAYTPYSVQRAMKNTAKRIETAEVFAQGPGLLQVDKALEHLLQHANDRGERLRFEVKVSGHAGGRGLYLRAPHDVDRPKNSTVTVRPVFPDKSDPRKKIHFALRINLQATEPWVEVGDHAVLTHGGMQFRMAVDPTKLPPGAHFAEIRGFDTTNPSRGPLFRVPITALRPTAIKPDGGLHRETIRFEPGTVARRFFVVPLGATWADLKLTAKTTDGESRRFVFHTVRLHRGESIDVTAERNYLTLSDGKTREKTFRVSGGHLQEVCLSQYWSSLNPSDVDIQLTFRGVVPDEQRVSLSPGHPQQRIEITSPFRKETLTPKAALSTHRAYYRPTSAVIAALDPVRDRLPDGNQISALTLTYEFDQKNAGSVTPRFPQWDGLLYDSPAGNFMWMLFDPGKRLIATDDIWPTSRRIGKGKHVLKLQIRHSDIAELERWKSMPLVLDRPLGRSLALSISGTRVDAAFKQAKFSSRTIGPGEHAALVISAPKASQLPANFADGDQLLGSVTYIKPDNGTSGDDRGKYPVVYAGAGTGRHRGPKVAVVVTMPVTGQWAARVRKMKLAELRHLAKTGKPSPKFEALFTELMKEKSTDLDVLTARLQLLDHVSFRKERLPEVVKAADAVLAKIDTQELAKHYGTNIDPENAKAVAVRKRMDAIKAVLAETLYRKGRALGYMELPDVLAKHPIADQKTHNAAFEANFAELRKWVDTTSRQFFLLHVRRERRHGRFAAALKLLERYAANAEPNYWYVKKRRDLFAKLGWTHLREYESRRLMLAFPKHYAPF